MSPLKIYDSMFVQRKILLIGDVENEDKEKNKKMFCRFSHENLFFFSGATVEDVRFSKINVSR